jgi:hypothetical protein
MRVIQDYYPGPGVALSAECRVSLIRVGVHPRGIRVGFGGVGGWLSGAGVVGFLSGAAVFFPATVADGIAIRQRGPAVGVKAHDGKSVG